MVEKSETNKTSEGTEKSEVENEAKTQVEDTVNATAAQAESVGDESSTQAEDAAHDAATQAEDVVDKTTTQAEDVAHEATPSDDKADDNTVETAQETKAEAPAESLFQTEDAQPTEDKSETVSAPDTTPAPPHVRQAGFGSLILGGALAALLGFVAARGAFLDDFLPPSWRANANQNALIEKIEGLSTAQKNLASAQSEIRDQMKELNEKLLSLANQPAEDTQDVEALLAEIAQLNARLSTLENRPVVVGEAAPSHDFSADFAALKEVAVEQQAKIAALLEEAQHIKQTAVEEAQSRLARAAAARIAAAVETGAPFAEALQALEETRLFEIPDVLRDIAEDGVITLAALQQSVSQAARDALAASPLQEESGLGGFLKRQLGVRSVKPREGDDPDAILSRMEAAVRNGDLSKALSEIEKLPQEAQAALSDWLEGAKQRLAVTTASQELVQRLAAN